MNLRMTLDKHQADHQHALRTMKNEELNLKKSLKSLESHQEALKITQEVAELVQETAHAQISSVVSRCLGAIFPEDLHELKIKFSQKRGRTEAELVFVKNGGEMEDPLNQAPGGHCDVAAFALRLACLVLSQPPKRKFIAWDEPFRNIHGGVYQERVEELLMKLSEELGVQVLILSDDIWMKFGKVVEL